MKNRLWCRSPKALTAIGTIVILGFATRAGGQVASTGCAPLRPSQFRPTRFSGVFGRLTPAGGLFYRTQSCGRARE